MLGRSPGGRHGNPVQYSYLENPHGQRSLGGYSPQGHKELDTTERLTHTLLCYKNVRNVKYQLGTGFAEMGERISVAVGELGCGNHR